MRLGILGGTFDPPHVGHLLAASDAHEILALDRVVFVPAAAQPSKAGIVAASSAHRLAMVRLLIGDDPRFAVDPIEIEREGLSYTVDTLSAFAGREPGAERFLLIGADAYRQFALWREPERIRALATIAVLAREEREGIALAAEPGVIRIPSRRVDVSSTEIRARARRGAPLRGFVPESVAAYIAAHGLYR